jgi:S-adenosylmethionine:tRNA-ribosyltransferase-isomerase (queuine synthetase)
MVVSAFARRDYQHAVAERYRFYSHGDYTLILQRRVIPAAAFSHRQDNRTSC